MSFFPMVLRKLKNTFFSPMFLRFVEIGIIKGANGVIFSYILSMLMPVNISFVIGYIASISVGYLLNSNFVFKRHITFRRYVRFCISYIPNFLIQNVCVFIMYNCLGWHEVIAFILSAIVAVPITYILVLISFRKA